MSLGFRHSDRVKGIEEALGWRVPSYERIAGTREASVSSTHHWWQRMDEYQSLQSLCAKITQLWPGRQAPAWVVSDDYGVAAQWALQCSEAGARLVLPLDPLFAGRSGSPAGMRPDDDVLILCVRARFEELVPDGDSWQELGELAHPVTGASLRVGRLLPRGAGPGHDDTLQRLPGED